MTRLHQLRAGLVSEYIKITRSRIFWITLVIAIVPMIMNIVFMSLLSEPATFDPDNMMASKIQGDFNWRQYELFNAQITISFGMVLIGVITSWLFGREFVDKTAKDLLALPVSRSILILSKMLTLLGWVITLFIAGQLIFTLGGWMLKLPEWSASVFKHHELTMLVAILLVTFVNSITAYLASYARGYLAPVGFVILMVVIANLMGALGSVHYFPWGIPSVIAILGVDGQGLGLLSYLIIALAGCLGMVGLFFTWLRRDHI